MNYIEIAVIHEAVDRYCSQNRAFQRGCEH